MKHNLLYLIFAFALFSCSSDDSTSGDSGGVDTNFFPQQPGNYWVYDVTSEQGEGRDSLYVSGTNTSNNQTYQTFATQNEIPFGFYSSVMTGGETRISGSKIYVNSSLNLSDIFGESLGDFAINIQDFLFFDANATQNQNLGTDEGAFEIPFQDGMNFNIEYTVNAKSGQSYSNYTTPDGEIYNDVKSVNFVISAKITINTEFMGFPVSYPILDQQNIISATQYYANNIGMIYSNTDYQYELNELPVEGIELPIPNTFSSNTKEVLDVYSVE